MLRRIIEDASLQTLFREVRQKQRNGIKNRSDAFWKTALKAHKAAFKLVRHLADPRESSRILTNPSDARESSQIFANLGEPNRILTNAHESERLLADHGQSTRMRADHGELSRAQANPGESDRIP